MGISVATHAPAPSAAGPRAPELRAVVDRYEAPLMRHAQRILRDAERARDVVQDTFLKLWERDIALDDPRLERWLFTVCRNRAIDVLRRESRVCALDPLPEVEVASKAEETHAVNEVFERIGELSPRKARVFELRFREGHSYRRIAELTGMSVSHVGVVIHKTVAALRKQLVAVATLVVMVGAAWYASRPAPASLGTFAPAPLETSRGRELFALPLDSASEADSLRQPAPSASPSASPSSSAPALRMKAASTPKAEPAPAAEAKRGERSAADRGPDEAALDQAAEESPPQAAPAAEPPAVHGF